MLLSFLSPPFFIHRSVFHCFLFVRHQCHQQAFHGHLCLFFSFIFKIYLLHCSCMIWAFFCIVTCLPAPSCFEPLSYIVQKVSFFSRTLLSLSLGDLQLPLIDVRFTLLLDCSLGLQITALQFLS